MVSRPRTRLAARQQLAELRRRLEAAEQALADAQAARTQAEAAYDTADDRFAEIEQALDEAREQRDAARRARYAARQAHERSAATVGRIQRRIRDLSQYGGGPLAAAVLRPVPHRPAARRRWGDGAQLRVTRNGHLIGYCLSPDDLPALGVDMSGMAVVARW